jgi:hypothetical protein
MVGLHFGQLFRKLIWTLWSHSYDDFIFNYNDGVVFYKVEVLYIYLKTSYVDNLLLWKSLQSWLPLNIR